MNILILGSGIVGANLAKKLSEQGKNVFLLDDVPNQLKDLSEKFDIKTIIDDPLNPSFYKNFNINIDYFIAVTQSDEKNIITSKFAKDYLNASKTIARIRNQNLISSENQKILIDCNSYLDHIISPELEVANNIFEKIHMPGAFFSESLISNGYLVIGMQSSEIFKHHTFLEINNFFKKNNICYLGHTSDEEEVLNFKKIADSNYLYLLVNKGCLNKMIKFFGFKDYVLNILLVGGGNIGHKLSQLIESDEQEINLKVLEKNIDKCNLLASSLDKASVFCGDALDQTLYDEINLSKSDLVITVTDNDQINTILSIIAKKRGAKSVISVINNDSFSSFANDLGIDIMINPRELTTSRIIEKISEGSLLSYHSILRDNYSIYEVKYKNDLYEQVKKSKDIIHVCSISDNKIILAKDDHIPVNSDVLILLVKNIHSKLLEKLINDY